MALSRYRLASRPPRRAMLIVGPRNCGKSEAVERATARRAQKAYFGTLWKGPLVAPVIERHLVRRGPGWMLGESQGRIESDYETLLGLCNQMQSRGSFVVDGLGTWLFHLGGFSWRRAEVHAVDLALCLSCMMTDRADLEWRLIDVTPDTLFDEAQPHGALAVRRLHTHLALYVSLLQRVVIESKREALDVEHYLGGRRLGGK